jgi:DNA/RNA-binding domain of Phe-tRNA-synthetase-like protein
MIRFELQHESLRLGVIRAGRVRCAPSSSELSAELARAESCLRADQTAFPEAVRAAIRDVLRKGGYKPTGRGKPASEFLLGAALGAGLPRINNVVDVLNLVSLKHAHPISLFDADALSEPLCVRFGAENERYVFNPSGQEMDVAGLPVICRGPSREAIGNAVKDSMHAKVHEGTGSLLAVVYGSAALAIERLNACCDELASQLILHARASELERAILPSG